MMKRREIKRKSIFPIETSDQRAGLFHNAAGLVGVISKTSQSLPLCTLFSCSHSLAAENLLHTVKHTHTHSLENRPHHKGWAASMPQGHKTEEMKTKTIRRKRGRERGMSAERIVF